jgi:hypothetical protein
MDNLSETGFVERPRFFDGQQLFASDLQGLEALDRELRWLHNRSLHQLGIGNGFAVTGRKGDREVAVQPGYAVDARGAEIVLLDTHLEQVPPVAGEPDGQSVFFDLTVSYPSDDDLEEAETREGVCLPRGAVRLRERPVFCWVRLKRDASGTPRAVDPAQAADLQAGLKIVLARAEVLNCRLEADLSIAQRRRARPPRQPAIHCGTETARWEVWSIDGSELGLVGLQAAVDTSAAGFRLTPCYSARVAGTRPLEVPVGDQEGEAPLFVLDLPPYVQEARPDGFTCNVLVFSLFGSIDTDNTEAVLEKARTDWGVTWLGIED